MTPQATTPPDPAASTANPNGLIPPSHVGRSEVPIGDLIVELGYATRETVERAIAVSREQHTTTGQTLVESGAIRGDQLARALAERFGLYYVDLARFQVDPEALKLIDVPTARRYRAVPIGFLPDRTVLLAMADPSNLLTVDELSMVMEMPIRRVAAAQTEVLRLINRLDVSTAQPLTGSAPPVPDRIISLDDGPDVDSPAVKLVQQMFARAVGLRASDIHLNPTPDGIHVQFRVDGMLVADIRIGLDLATSVIARIKVIADLDIAERHKPQDGRMQVLVEGRRIEVRVVTLPLVHGEGAVLRVLDTTAGVRDIESLGMSDHDAEVLVNAARQAAGAVLVTGPAGSGKTTTIYSLLRLLSDGERNVLTIEDPVESLIPGTNQMQVAPRFGVTFAAALRSMLRADPDVVMVGEIRDAETATIAIQASLTGHLMLSTLHTRSAVGALLRLIDMGVEPFMVVAAVECVVAQRLARRLCVHCRARADVPESVLDEHGLVGSVVYEPAGCLACSQTGYDGRIGLYEVLTVTRELRTALLERKSIDEMIAIGRTAARHSLREDGMAKVRQGVTSLAEVARVVSSV